MDKSMPICRNLPELSLNTLLTERRISALGNDIVSIPRIASLLTRGGDRFMRRCFTPAEVSDCLGKANPPVHFAGRWAAKEAVFKALRLKWDRPFSWKEIEIVSGPDHAPLVRLSPAILKRYPPDQVPEILLSISHCSEYAYAVALVLTGQKSEVKR